MGFTLFIIKYADVMMYIFGGFLFLGIIYLFFSVVEGYRVWRNNHKL